MIYMIYDNIWFIITYYYSYIIIHYYVIKRAACTPSQTILLPWPSDHWTICTLSDIFLFSICWYVANRLFAIANLLQLYCYKYASNRLMKSVANKNEAKMVEIFCKKNVATYDANTLQRDCCKNKLLQICCKWSWRLHRNRALARLCLRGGILEVEVSLVHCSGLPKTFKNAT